MTTESSVNQHKLKTEVCRAKTEKNNLSANFVPRNEKKFFWLTRQRKLQGAILIARHFLKRQFRRPLMQNAKEFFSLITEKGLLLMKCIQCDHNIKSIKDIIVFTIWLYQRKCFEWRNKPQLETVKRRRVTKTVCCLLCKKSSSHANFTSYGGGVFWLFLQSKQPTIFMTCFLRTVSSTSAIFAANKNVCLLLKNLPAKLCML